VIIAILFLLVVLSISLLVTRLASMALILTGMSKESARFQARSALAGVGFTTRESEMVVIHPVRRRIIMLLMLTGHIGVPTVVATLVVSLITTAQSEHWWKPVLLLGAGLIMIAYAAHSRWIERHLNRVLALFLKRWTDLDVRDYVALLQLQNGFAVTEMLVDAGDWLEGKTLATADLSHEGILVLGIQRAGGDYIGAPRAEDPIHAGDTLVLYGWVDRLREIDQRKTEGGDDAHWKAIAELAAHRPVS
jgi:hypothetical protein